MEGMLLYSTLGWGIAFAPLIWILVIVGIVLLARGSGWSPPWATSGPGRGRETAIDVLERRFAEDEISLEQYRERRAVLEESS